MELRRLYGSGSAPPFARCWRAVGGFPVCNVYVVVNPLVPLYSCGLSFSTLRASSVVDSCSPELCSFAEMDILGVARLGSS